MVHAQFRFPSRILGRSLELHALFPRPQGLLAAQTCPVTGKHLWFLHGIGDDPETVLVHTDLAALVDELGLTVLLPAIENSFSLDLEPALAFRSYLTEELMPFAHETLRLSVRREDALIGGISMGGYSALSIALTQPERFAKAFALSGALDLKAATRYSRIVEIPLAAALADRKALALREDWELARQMETLCASGLTPPALYLSCSEADMVYPSNEALAARAAALGLPLELHSAPGYHNWDYWRANLRPALEWALG